MFKILFIEESFDMRETVKDYFKSVASQGLSIDFAYDLQRGLEKVRNGSYDLLMVDCKPSGEMGIDTCRRLRENSSCAIVHITSMEDEDEVEQGYALSADEYLAKPYSPSELYTMVSEIADKKSKMNNVTTIECGGIRMNPVTGIVTVDGRLVELTPRSAKMLGLLLSNKNSVVSRDEILNEVWGDGFGGSERVVDNHIKKLRRSLGRKGGLIRTVKGIGYGISEKRGRKTCL
ncbi:MAG: response regulator transcription factor [Clostridiales bacterium]|nr:response regulator transcription factor [Clostridiales bacterium]